jgi:hypothetical protein
MPKRRKRRAPQEILPGWQPRRLAIVVIALLAALVIVAFLRMRKDPAAAAPAVAEEAPQRHPVEPTLGMVPIAPSALATASAAPPDPPPIIDEILVEKPEVCAGEENLITVRAHTRNGSDEFLHYVIDGQMGQSLPVRLWRDQNGVQGQHSITVFGRGGSMITAPLPQYEVKDCRPKYIVGIQARLMPNTWGEFSLLASMVGVQRAPTDADRQRDAPPMPPGAKPFKAVSYTWNFGDGETATTLAPDVEHSYEGRAQQTLYSYFVVSVEVRGAKGERESGRMALALMNPSFETLKEKGVVTLMVSLEPRFPQLDADGRVTQHVRIWHGQPGPVTIDHVAMVKYFVGASGETAPNEVDAPGVLGATTIPPGKDGITTTVTLDTAAEPDTFSVTYLLRGTSAEGYPAAGSFSVMQPPPRPTADSGAAMVADPVLTQKILLARQLLGRDTVTDEDLWRLEHEGKFADLKVAPRDLAAARAAAMRAGPPSPTNMPQ